MPKAISFSLGLTFIYLKEYLLLRNKALKMQVSIEGTDILKDSEGADKNSSGYFGRSDMPVSLD